MPAKSDAKTERGLMEIIEASARHGKLCPRLHELSALLGVSTEKLRLAFDALRKAHKIAWETPYHGLGVGKVRIVRILATGQETARPVYQGRVAGKIAAPRADRNEIERAKTVLRRLGHVVFDAAVTDGSSGKGLIKIDNKNFTPAEVLARAASMGRV